MRRQVQELYSTTGWYFGYGRIYAERTGTTYFILRPPQLGMKQKLYFIICAQPGRICPLLHQAGNRFPRRPPLIPTGRQPVQPRVQDTLHLLRPSVPLCSSPLRSN